MSMDFAERVTVAGTVYALDTFPLEPYRRALPGAPRLPGWPGCSNGYHAGWEVRDDALLLMQLNAPQAHAQALGIARAALPLAATWFSGLLRCRGGEQRRTGYPPRTFSDEELFFDVAAGRVVRAWALDLTMVPDQTYEEQCLSLPAFLHKYLKP